ncbi:hypothetical protein MUK42_07566, partial [Musa troglodytarum]
PGQNHQRWTSPPPFGTKAREWRGKSTRNSHFHPPFVPLMHHFPTFESWTKETSTLLIQNSAVNLKLTQFKDHLQH